MNDLACAFVSATLRTISGRRSHGGPTSAGIVAFCAFLGAAQVTIAQPSTPQPLTSYPSKPVRLVVPYPPGGTSDLVARTMSQELEKRLAQPFAVENRPGAGGQIGTTVVAHAPPDGYILLIGASGPVSYLPALATRPLPYDIEKDFEPVANLVTVPNLMIVRGDSRIDSIDGLVEIETNGLGKVNFGSAGPASSGHIAGELLNVQAGIKMKHVPYRGSGPALMALIGGEIDVMFENLPSALSQVRPGALRGIAVLGNKRSPSAPEFPTTAELGFPDLVIASSTGILAPKGTSREIVRLLEKTLQEILTDRKTIAKLTALGADIDYMDSAQYQAYIKDELKRWAAVGRQAQIAIQ